MIHTAETEPSISTIAVVPRRRAIAVRPAMPADRRSIHALFAALHRFNASLEPGFALAAGWDAHLDAHLEREWAGEHGVTLLAWDGAG